MLFLMKMKICMAAIFTIAILFTPFNETALINGDGETYHNIYIMTYGSAHNFKVNGFHRENWGKGNDSYVYIAYYGPSLLPIKCKIWNESVEKWINVKGHRLEMRNFSGWIIYLRGILQPYIVFVYGKCEKLETAQIR